MPKDSKKSNKKKKQQFLPVGTLLINGDVTHEEKSQKVFMTLDIQALGTEELPNDAEFTTGAAINTLYKLEKKHHADLKCMVLREELLFNKQKPKGKGPFRVSVTYSELKGIINGGANDNCFVLHVHSKENNKKYYEVYRSNDQENLQQFITYIKKAMSDPEYLVRGARESVAFRVKNPRAFQNEKVLEENKAEDELSRSGTSTQSRSPSPVPKSSRSKKSAHSKRTLSPEPDSLSPKPSRRSSRGARSGKFQSTVEESPMNSSGSKYHINGYAHKSHRTFESAARRRSNSRSKY